MCNFQNLYKVDFPYYEFNKNVGVYFSSKIVSNRYRLRNIRISGMRPNLISGILPNQIPVRGIRLLDKATFKMLLTVFTVIVQVCNQGESVSDWNSQQESQVNIVAIIHIVQIITHLYYCLYMYRTRLTKLLVFRMTQNLPVVTPFFGTFRNGTCNVASNACF